ncbi:hypothetical protein DL546_005858 [Coniochaeta pulveracea]|uniref:Uncharacterized protein n=1 Tax=Coniochaeta pulveracea TaxID=177199 RepID=A0A420YI08_9PEZI|nr:hypothetical protein DL546_005858 [Coniochaeta pulveracea]
MRTSWYLGSDDLPHQAQRLHGIAAARLAVMLSSVTNCPNTFTAMDSVILGNAAQRGVSCNGAHQQSQHPAQSDEVSQAGMLIAMQRYEANGATPNGSQGLGARRHFGRATYFILRPRS